jgi:hypothetical protein
VTRRLTAAAGVAFAVLALAACRDSPDVAAYIGDTTITEKHLTEAAQPYANQLTREQVLQFLVADALCAQVTADAGVKVPAPSSAPPAGTPELAIAYNRLQSCLKVIPSQPVEVTDADVREVFDTLIAGGQIDPNEAVNYEANKEQFAQQVRSQEVGMADALGRRKTLLAALDSSNVSINPRYGDLTVPILSVTDQQQQQIDLLTANLNSRVSAIIEAPASQAPAAPQATEAPAAN